MHILRGHLLITNDVTFLIQSAWNVEHAALLFYNEPGLNATVVLFVNTAEQDICNCLRFKQGNDGIASI